MVPWSPRKGPAPKRISPGGPQANLVTWTVLAHGGAGSFDNTEKDGPEAATRAGIKAFENGGGPLDAAVAATVVLEDDPRFNAGTGSNLRLDGRTIEMEASVMTDDGRFGAVACIERVKNPVLVAKALHPTPHNLLAGRGATAYARRHGHQDHDPLTPNAQAKFERVRRMVESGRLEPGWFDWDLVELRKHWNYEPPLQETLGPSDTVGAVASDGTRFAAALSTGGTTSTLLGRVGDVPLPGCGLHAGDAGAVCVTGDGDHLARARLADRVYQWMQQDKPPETCIEDAIALFPQEVAVGLILVTPEDKAGGSNLKMAWHVAEVSP